MAYTSWLHVWRVGDDALGCPHAAAVDACGERTVMGSDEDRVTIPTEGLPHKGATIGAARVTMLECSDFDCPYSRRASGTVDELLADNPDLAFFHLHLPLPMHEHAMLKAVASVAAQRQGRFWEMHDALYDARVDSPDAAIALARRLGLDTDRFAADLRDPTVRAEVDRQRALCGNAGVRAVPTFFINGRRVIGSRPTADFQRVIDEERR